MFNHATDHTSHPPKGYGKDVNESLAVDGLACPSLCSQRALCGRFGTCYFPLPFFTDLHSILSDPTAVRHANAVANWKARTRESLYISMTAPINSGFTTDLKSVAPVASTIFGSSCGTTACSPCSKRFSKIFTSREWRLPRPASAKILRVIWAKLHVI